MIKASYLRKTLHFVRPAGTSRGILYSKPAWYFFLYDSNDPLITGIGECSYIPGLSEETEEKLEQNIQEICSKINNGTFDVRTEIPSCPSMGFAIEAALLDLSHGGQRILFPSGFVSGHGSIPINGLIWMGNMNSMLKQIDEKIAQNYRCLKLKIGALEFSEELEIISYIRRHFSAKELELRVDANGAFKPDNVMNFLYELARFDIHSIEQPVEKGQWDQMAEICSESPVPVALDEELTGFYCFNEKENLIRNIKPQYLVLKPGLLGGFKQASEYINLAKEAGIGWWVTSSLESNIGLNALAQWTYTLGNNMPQGLGTGLLYKENVVCPLELSGDRLCYNVRKKWDLSFLDMQS